MRTAGRVLLGLALVLAGAVATMIDADAAAGRLPAAAVALVSAALFVGLPGHRAWPRFAAGCVYVGVAAWAWAVEPALHHEKLLPAAAVLAWVVAEAGARRQGAVDPGLAGREAACGVVAAAYVTSGVMKVALSGASWFDGAGLALLVAERSGPMAGPFAPLRDLVWRTPALTATLATLAVAIEVAGVVFVWRRHRLFYAAAAVSMHLGIAVLLGYVYLSWMLLVVALALLTRR